MVGNERNGSDGEDDGLPPPKEDSSAKGTHIEQLGNEDEAPDLRAAIDTEQDQSVGKQQDGRKVRAPPNLSLDTTGALRDQYLEVGSHRRALSTSDGPQSAPGARPPVQSLRFSPLSPRPRDRSFSLRKQLFTRNVQGEPEGSRSAIELQPAVHNASSSQKLRRDFSKKSSTTVTVSPINQDYNSVRIPERLAKSSQSPSALPHYETWLKGSVTRSGIFSKLKATHRKIRNVILRIQELPPSKDGRQLTLCIDHTKARIDERTSREYVDNTIRSCKYTLWNFLPRQLYAQFSKLANFYFLCVSILQMIPGLSTTGTYTTIGPLAFFVMLSMAKEGYDDIRRYKLDKTENNKLALVLGPHRSLPSGDREDDNLAPVSPDPLSWSQTKWKDVRVGDVVRLTRDEATPADLVILQAKGLDGISYVETMALDGETNLKSKQPSPALAKNFQSTNDILESKAHIVVEDPNLDLYNFEGKITAANETLPLTNNEIIYRGSVIRNTPEVLGMVIYTGEECKIRMNATKNPRIKAPALQDVVNKVVIIIVLFVLALAIFNTVAYQIWRESTEDKSWYLVDASVSFFPILASFIIIFNTMIPLSLYVSLEIVKLFQLVLMHDIEMYDEESNTPIEARTSTINEELGQVK